MTIRTSTKTGNSSDSTVWGASLVTGDQIVIASGHTVTIDAAITLGGSPPPTPTNIPTATATGGGASGGSLPSGAYRFRVANWDGATESCAGPENSVTIASTNIPRFTIGALPTGVTSRRLYLTAAAGAAGTETLYATGITTTTFDASSASWTDGTTTQAGAAVMPNARAVTVQSGGAFIIGTSITLTVRGDIEQQNAPITMNAGATITFDAGSSVGTTNTYYWWRTCSGGNQSSATITINGTSGNYCVLNRAASSANFIVGPLQDGGVGGAWTNHGNLTITYLRITNCGDTTRDGWATSILSATQNISISNMIADTCVRVPRNVYSLPAAGNYTLTNVSYKNTPVGSEPYRVISGTINTATKSLIGCRFDQAPAISGLSWTYDGCYFDKGWTDPGASNPWTIMQNCGIRLRGTATQVCSGDVKNCFVFPDNTAAATTFTGTASSATNGGASTGTFVDSSKSWGASQFPIGLTCYALIITGGTGAGQVRAIANNSGNTLTTYPLWDVVPDLTSTFEIRLQNYNVHFIGAAPINRVWTWDSLIFDSPLHVDNNGDCFYELVPGTAGATGIAKNCIMLPSVCKDNIGTPYTRLNTDTNAASFNHCTYFTGAQSAVVGEQTGTGTAGTMSSHRSNIAWCEPSKNTLYGSLNVSITTGLGPYVVCDSGHGVSNAVSDLITAGNCDYNCSYGNLTISGFGGNVGPYKYTYTTAPGAHDVSGDPGFLDRWRNLLKWGATFLSANAVNPFTNLATVVNAILASNDTADGNYNANAVLSGNGNALIDWVRAGFTPTLAGLKNAGHDGATIGAVEYVGIHYDAAANSGYQAAASSYSGAASWNGTNRMLSIDVQLLSVTDTVTAMTYGGATCTQIGAQNVAGGTGRVECWRILQSDSGAPAAGSNTLSVTISGSLAFAVTWVSRTGVHQTSPTEGFNSASGINVGAANASVVIPPAADNAVVHAACATNDTAASANQTSRNDVTGTAGSGIDEDSGATPITPAAAQTMTVAVAALKMWTIAGYAVRPVAADPLGSVQQMFMMMGMGA